jgi:hypothetical protein
MHKQRIFDPRDPDYDGPDDDDDEKLDLDEIDEPWEHLCGHEADYIMTEAELRGHL